MKTHLNVYPIVTEGGIAETVVAIAIFQQIDQSQFALNAQIDTTGQLITDQHIQPGIETFQPVVARERVMRKGEQESAKLAECVPDSPYPK